MKNSTRNVIDSFPLLEEYLINSNKEIDGLNQVELTFLQLIRFFEEPEKSNFDVQMLYQNLSDDWLYMALTSMHLFFENDTYLMKNVTHSIIKEGKDYLNQTDFVDYLNKNGQNYSLAKMSVYIQRKIIPSPDLVISDTRYWLKSSCEKFLKKIQLKEGNYNV